MVVSCPPPWFLSLFPLLNSKKLLVLAQFQSFFHLVFSGFTYSCGLRFSGVCAIFSSVCFPDFFVGPNLALLSVVLLLRSGGDRCCVFSGLSICLSFFCWLFFIKEISGDN